MLLALLGFPGVAAYRLAQSIDARWIGGYAAFASSVTCLLYWHDKRRAQNGGWRVPESTLHTCELLGGWPGGFAAQRMFRHKNAKGSYQFAFWTIVLVHQIIALDFVRNWTWLRAILLIFHR